MVQFSSIFTGITKSIAIRNVKKSKHHDIGRETANAMAKEAKKNEMMLTSSGSVVGDSHNLPVVYSKGGKKGINQDRFVVWEDFGCQDDMIFCGVFDGHGPWGHIVAKRVRKLMPPALLRNWQKRIVDGTNGISIDRSCCQFDIWKQSYFETCSIIDQELEQYADSFYSGTTALTLVKQGDLLVVANVGDSRAVLATTDDDGRLVSVQLTVDLKPNLPRESERIMQSRGRVLSCEDEPGVYRVWMPTVEGPGLAISRAFGDYYIKDFGLISEPELTYRNITHRDQFAILATDGVWDVMSNEEAVEIVSSTEEREEALLNLPFLIESSKPLYYWYRGQIEELRGWWRVLFARGNANEGEFPWMISQQFASSFITFLLHSTTSLHELPTDFQLLLLSSSFFST